MNHREHLQKILAGKASEWVPNYELGWWEQTCDQWLSEGMPEEAASIDMFNGGDLFQLDPRNFASLHLNMNPGFEREVLEESERVRLTRHENGIVRKELKDGEVRGSRMSMDAFVDFPVKDRKTWNDVKRRYDPTDPTRYPDDWNDLVAGRNGGPNPVILLTNGAYGLYSQLRWWAGTENISYMFYDSPALVEEMVEFHTEFLLALIDRALTTVQFDYFSFFEDCAGKNTPLFGPDIFRKFFMAPYKRIIERMRKAGIASFWVDCDGSPDPLIPLWLEAGINCLWPLEQASGMDPRRLRKEYGKDLILCGGIDKRELAKDRAAIDRELESKIPSLIADGGYIPHLDHAVQPGVSYDNYMYYIDRKMELLGR